MCARVSQEQVLRQECDTGKKPGKVPQKSANIALRLHVEFRLFVVPQ